MKPTLKLGSLFDGIGAVPYAASFFGIETLWASEILPNAVSVTRRHFPGMEHMGDVTKLDGGKLPSVDIIAFGSPCQSWSVAGDRSGLDGKSGLFMEAIRIIREMRKATNGKYPQVALFENVTGLLNCGAGGRSNYQTVLEAFTETDIPMPESGRWSNAGMVRGRGIDLAWIVKDSQHYRTAQRRKRLFVVIDFTGQRAGEILFVSKSLSGYFAARERERERTAANIESGAGSAGEHIAAVYGICSDKSNSMRSDNPHSGIYEAGTSRTLDQNCANPACNQGGMVVVEPQIARTLTARHDSPPCADRGQNVVALSAGTCLNPWDVQSRRVHADDGTWPALYGGDGGGRGYAAQTSANCLNPWDTQQARIFTENSVSPTLAGADGGGGRNPAGLVMTEAPQAAYGFDLQQITSKTNRSSLKEVQPSLCSAGNPHVVHPPVTGTLCASGKGLSRPAGNAGETDLCVAAIDCRNLRESAEVSGTLQSKCTGGHSLNYQNPVRTGYIVRRLTPTEAERLMSLPDDWTAYGHDGKLMSDSARYQMCGNSIVVNVLACIMQNISDKLKQEV